MLALAICSACSGAPAIAPSNAAPNVEYFGKALSVNGRLVTAARPNLSARPVSRRLFPTSLRSRTPTSTSSTTTVPTPAFSTIRRAISRSVRSTKSAAKGARTSSTATGRRPSGSSRAATQIRCTRSPRSRSRRSLSLRSAVQLRHGYQRRPCSRKLDQRRHRDLQDASGSGTEMSHAIDQRVLRRLRQQRESLLRRL